MKKFAFTCGDINGIGPEICIKTFNKVFAPTKVKIYLYIPSNIFEEAAKLVKPTFDYEIQNKIEEVSELNKLVTIIDLGKVKKTTGSPSKSSGDIAVKSIRMAFESVIRGKADALITSPLSKEALELANVKYPGHTEMLAEWSRAKHFTMMFVSNKMKCALVTIHDSIKTLSDLISKRNVYSTLKTVKDSLVNDFGIRNPKIAVLGFNPHAGESGRIGMEEEIVIKPVIKSFQDKSFNGPFVPDAFFGNKSYSEYDMVIGMYHDQVLIPFKMLSFDKGVNYTAGLPIIRTSPDHGTAFDIAWTNKAKPDSMIEAYKLASKLIDTRKIK